MTATYFDWPGEHYSTLKHILTSPLAYARAKAVPLPDRDAFRLGRAAHTAILEPHRFEHEYVVWDSVTDSGRSSPRTGKRWDAFCDEHAGKTILTVAQVERARAMAAAVNRHPVASRIIQDPTGRAELPLRWVEGQTPCKSRLDLVTEERLVEVKTTQDPAPARFASTAMRLRYALQMHMYSAALRAVEGIERVPTVVAVQSAEPFDVVVFRVGADVMERGAEDFRHALEMLHACKELDQWPGQAHEEEVELRLPLWAVDESERGWGVTVTEERTDA